MGAIEQETEEHAFCPSNDGKVTLTEVAHRAGIGDTILRNQHHRETRDSAHKWLAKLNKSAATTAPKARAVAATRSNFMKTPLEK